MTVHSSIDQANTSSYVQPRLNVQQVVQKGLQQDDKNIGGAGSGSNANKQVLAVVSNSKPVQSLQQTASSQISKGYLDIKV